jgi:hypothetical protein
MAWKPPGRGELVATVRFEERAPTVNFGGVVRDDWQTFCPTRRVRLLPTRGGELTIADRLAGVSAWVLDVPADSLVRQITTDMRVVDENDETRVFAIRSSLDLNGKEAWRTMTLQLGVEP